MRSIDLSSPELLDLATEILGRGDRLRFRAQGSSMTPYIRHDDLVEVEPVAPEEAALGDILLLRDERGRLLLHRMIGWLPSESGPRILSKGDALPLPDTAISADQVLGRVIALLRQGRRINLRAGRRRLLGKLRALFTLRRCF